jgi:hypothetical protein
MVHLDKDIVWLNEMFINNKSDFINIPRRPYANSRDTLTNNKADNNPGNESDLDNEFQFDEEYDNPDITNNTFIENVKTTRSGRVRNKPKRF